MDILVSILTPCYNGAKYIDRYAKSLLAQDYSNCQLIFMDDGSTDNSKELIMSYEKQFKDRGFSFEYYYHDNLGLGATIAEGIKYVKGSYLVWPDVDDTLPVDSISKKVFYLEQKAEYGLVRTRFMREQALIIQRLVHLLNLILTRKIFLRIIYYQEVLGFSLDVLWLECLHLMMLIPIAIYFQREEAKIGRCYCQSCININVDLLMNLYMNIIYVKVVCLIKQMIF